MNANRAATMTRRGFLAPRRRLVGERARSRPRPALACGACTRCADYRALVCVFLYGGDDANNTIVPLDAAGYAQYAAVRTAASGVQLSQATLLPIQPKSAATPFGLHPSLAPIHPLFASGKAAFAINVGTLTQPTTKAQYQAGVRPASLYSHSDQQTQWQTASSSIISNTGWGGRIADAQQSSNPNRVPGRHVHGRRDVVRHRRDVETALGPGERNVRAGWRYRHAGCERTRCGTQGAARHRSRQSSRRRSLRHHAAGDRPLGVGQPGPGGTGARVRHADDVDRAAACGGGEDDRSAQRTRREPAGVLRSARRLRHPLQPDHDAGGPARPARAGVARFLRHDGCSSVLRPK